MRWTTSAWTTSAWMAGAWLAISTIASAAPILVIDTDPDAPGIQPVREVALGEVFTASVAVLDVDAPLSLHAYEFDVAFVPGVLGALEALDSGFLQPEIFVLESTIGAAAVGLAATTIGQLGSSGAGELARIRFEATALGTSPLDLSSVILSEPDGVEILEVALEPGLIEVVAPEPSIAWLLLPPLLAGALRRGRVRGG